jgi:glycoprotein endo-alpha-1,2-mannosidase
VYLVLAAALAGCMAPAMAQDGPTVSRRVHAFYYPWYGNPETDGQYQHWSHAVAVRQGPPRAFPGGEDIAADFYPAMGCYSSNRPADLDAHMKQLRRAGVGVISVSWWGNDSYTDRAVPKLLDAATREGLRVNFHIEPFPARSARTTRDAIAYLLDRYGSHPAFYRNAEHGNRPMFYVYDSYLVPPEEWATILSPQSKDTIRGTPLDAVVIGLWVKEGDGEKLLAAGFDGFYTYFAVEGFVYGSTPKHWPAMAAFAREHKLLFVPSVGPGYDDLRIRPWNGRNTRSRDGGKYYDRMFQAALDVRTEVISITSFNEWHEGTQIEPAVPKTVGDHAYQDYRPHEPDYYLGRTRYWMERFVATASGGD